MSLENIYRAKSFSPWVFVTYDCSCKCPYCMIPEMNTPQKIMSSETFRKMCEVTEKLFENETYNQAHFRLSGGEPFLVFNNYKDIVVEYKKKYPNQINFGILTNLTIWNDEIADWMEENKIGMQISIDDLINGKPLQNGQSSSDILLANIQKVQTRNISFSFNTVLDINKRQNLTKLANFVASFKNIEWGLNASYTDSDDSKVKDIIKVFDNCISQLVKKGFDIKNKLRFYNSVVGTGRGGCSAGVNSFGLGTNLEIWPCQSDCNKDPIGYFDENIKTTLMTASGNEYYRERRLLRECSDCPVLGLCRGGCRATHCDEAINESVCQIRRDILQKLANGYYYQGMQNYHQQGCNHNHNQNYSQCQQNIQCQNNTQYQQNNACQTDHSKELSENISNAINSYVESIPEDKKEYVETPAIN